MKINRDLLLMRKLSYTVFCFFIFVQAIYTQHSINDLIPAGAATHTSQSSGDWFDPDTWAEGTVPGDAAIVNISSGDTVTYEGQSSAHIFAIRVDGVFLCQQSTSTDTTTLTFDTFIGTMSSKIQFHAKEGTDGSILVNIKPFDIEAHEAGTSGFTQTWNSTASSHFSDLATHYQVTYDIGPDDRFKTYALSQSGTTTVTETSRVAINDASGVLGRTDWDSTQLSIGLVTMGQLEIIGQEKSTMHMLSADAPKSTNTLSLVTAPADWQVGDTILITLGGNKNATSNANETARIAAISGTNITLDANLKKNHLGRAQDSLHCYVGNLNRNIIFKSVETDSTHRGHLMAMHNSTNVQIKNAAFIDMGRTDKSRLLDDRIWTNWVEPKVDNPYVSALGQECSQLAAPPAADISNHRGRYSIHLHQLGSTYGNNLAEVTGNVIWGNPGWGITHHSSYADVSENIIYQVTGAALVSEAGDETGFWDNNLIVEVEKGHTFDDYESSLFYDDYLFKGIGMAMKGRAVVCRGNVIADANMAISINNFNAAINSTARIDATALANLRPGFVFDQFPLAHDTLAAEGEGILPLEVALILENNTVINSLYGLSSIERDMGVNHESRSVFHNLRIWGANTGVRITYQNDYSFRDLFISGRNDNGIGLYMWKHAHNHSFEGIKLVDLKEGITASKLVENSSYTTKKTRNNGFTPWLFIDLETENVTDLYGIHLDDNSSTTSYTEHPDNVIHLDSSQLSMVRPITFTLNESADLEIDLGLVPADLRFEVDGVVTDRIGAYEFGIDQASSMDNLRNAYETRVYEFASEAKLEEYLNTNGVYEDPDDGSLYFIIYEYVPDRITYEYKAFPIRVTILNPPSGSPYNSPLTEPTADLEPQNELISRAATATQSSISNSEVYESTTIYTPASRAIDGNSNARINAKFYQLGMDTIGSSAITQTELEPWWEMDLGEEKIIEHIDIWNTVDLQGTAKETPSNTFVNFYVLIDDQPFGNISLANARTAASYEYFKDDSDTSRVLSIDTLNLKGRYIRVQAVGTTKLSLAEVDVIGRSISSNADCNGVTGGTAYLDECDQCVGGDTGSSPCSLDANYVWGGSATSSTLSSAVLPVELIEFTGILINQETRLDWSTALEEKVLGFEIERSKNGRDWDYFSYVAANNQASSYRTWDRQPFNGATYYRLKIIDLDGTYNHSKVVAVFLEGSTKVSLYPNPSSGYVNIKLEVEHANESQLNVVDILGRNLYQQQLNLNTPGTHFIEMDCSSFIPGTYFLQLQNDKGKPIVFPFVIAKD